jgi:hypothetical protein
MDLQPNSHYCFSKILRILFDFLNNTYWVSRNRQFFCRIESIKFECNAFVLVLVQIDLIHVEHTKCISSVSIKINRNLFLFLINTLLLYIPLLALTDGEMNTLASRGLEEPFFQLCCCVMSVFGSGGKCGSLLYIFFQQIILGSSGK